MIDDLGLIVRPEVVSTLGWLVRVKDSRRAATLARKAAKRSANEKLLELELPVLEINTDELAPPAI